MDEIFPQLPDDLGELTDEELSAFSDEFRATARRIASRDEDTIEQLSAGSESEEQAAAQILAAMTSGVEALERLKAEQESRLAGADQFSQSLEELAARVGDEPEPEGDEGENGEGDEEGEPEGAAAEGEPVTAAARPRLPLPNPRRNRPAATVDNRAVLRASAGVADIYSPGTALDRKMIGELMYQLVRSNRIMPGQRMTVASASFPYPPERQLDAKHGESNVEKMQAVQEQIDAANRNPEALVASGGLCAPLTPIYDLPGVESAVRPVRDALANFQATRGGVIVGENPTLPDYAEAVGVVEAADDALGGTYAVKDCFRIECPTFSEVEVDAIYSCIEAGNLTARAYPELMSRIDTLVRANFARTADSRLLDYIVAGSTAVAPANTTSTASALWKLVGHLHMAAMGMRSRHRITMGTRLRAVFPEWLIDLLTVDSARNGNDADRFKTRAELEAILGRANVNLTFYADTPSTGNSQVVAAQTAGAMLGFPDTVQWGLWPEGSWLHLDSGTLDLGIVRDSTLNSTNDFQIFAESWEAAALVGVESQWITSTIAPNGTFSAPKDFSASTDF